MSLKSSAHLLYRSLLYQLLLVDAKRAPRLSAAVLGTTRKAKVWWGAVAGAAMGRFSLWRSRRATRTVYHTEAAEKEGGDKAAAQPLAAPSRRASAWKHANLADAAEMARRAALLARIVDYWQKAAADTRASKRKTRRDSFVGRAMDGPRTSLTNKPRRNSWIHSLLEADPRRNILDFFLPGDERGPLGMLRAMGSEPSGKSTTTYFSVWRPTSFDAIRMMMMKKATGKGLNIKGKSAKRGQLSGFVPYLQISEEDHKRKVSTSPPSALVRIYYATRELRDTARAELASVLAEMTVAVREAEAALEAEKATGVDIPDEIREAHLTTLRWAMDRPQMIELDTAGPGLEMPERLLWEAYVMRQDISHPEGWETGRPSEPDYMDLNLHSTRHVDADQPRVVVYQVRAAQGLASCGLPRLPRLQAPRPSKAFQGCLACRPQAFQGLPRPSKAASPAGPRPCPTGLAIPRLAGASRSSAHA